ncbi:hypothetical protein [Edaphobacter aggregans]|uniref:hypothetical protein n=1 Tax=Edaphobacter aggregans TaxID=570835 RepID=UPI000556E4D0|nr:hypothetical protein [Edaphobacter aggregans]
MASIPLVALNARTPEQPDLIGNYGRILQIKNMIQQQQQQQQESPLRMQALQQGVQQGGLALQQAQQGQQDQQAFRAAMQDPSLQGKTIGEVADVLAKSGHISQTGWAGAKKMDLEHQEAVQKLETGKLANIKAAHDQTQQLYNNVMNLPDDQLAAYWPQIAQQYDAIPGNQKQPLDPNKPLTKQQLAQFGPALSMANSYLDQELARRQKQAELQQTQGKSDPTSPFYAPSQASISMGTAPGADQIKAGEVRQAGQKAGAQAAARQPYELALARQKQALSQGDPNAAAQLLVDGDATLSELKARGATPEFIAKTLTAAKQLSGGKYNAQSADAQFSVAKSPANVAFFGSAKSLTDPGGTLDQLAAVAKNIPGYQITAFNSIADWEKAATSNGPLAHYASTALGVADDYAKVMGGGQGSDTSRLQALNLIKSNAGPEARGGALEGIRGAVVSQTNSRIGNNPILKRMYGDIESAPNGNSAPAGDPFAQFGGKAH